MYEEYSRQALPPRKYRELLGAAVCVFNANNAFIIENILRLDSSNELTWYKLLDKESGKLCKEVKKVITANGSNQIEVLFSELVTKRNRIIHSFQITNSSGEQSLATKEKEKHGNTQFEITEEYLLSFIKENERLTDLLHQLRGF